MEIIVTYSKPTRVALQDLKKGDLFIFAHEDNTKHVHIISQAIYQHDKGYFRVVINLHTGDATTFYDNASSCEVIRVEGSLTVTVKG